MKTITRYAAFDGKEFDSAADCRKYENDHSGGRLIGLTPEQIEAAMDRKVSDRVPDALEIADAIERVAYQISKKRIESGDVRRKRKSASPVAMAAE